MTAAYIPAQTPTSWARALLLQPNIHGWAVSLYLPFYFPQPDFGHGGPESLCSLGFLACCVFPHPWSWAWTNAPAIQHTSIGTSDRCGVRAAIKWLRNTSWKNKWKPSQLSNALSCNSLTQKLRMKTWLVYLAVGKSINRSWDIHQWNIYKSFLKVLLRNV